MREYRLRPKNNFLHTATWEEIYTLTEHWLSELDFFKDEITFLDSLLGKYFIWIAQDGKLELTEEISAIIINLNKEQEALSRKIHKHLKDISLLMENAFDEKEEWFREEHMKLEESLADFTKRFRKAKKDVFLFTERAMVNHKSKKLLSS